MICQFSLEYVLDGKSFDKIFLRDFVASKVQVLKLVKKPPNSQPSMSLLLRPEEHTFDHFWPEKGRLFLTKTLEDRAAKNCEQIIYVHCLIE